jgi:hypothetical protein
VGVPVSAAAFSRPHRTVPQLANENAPSRSGLVSCSPSTTGGMRSAPSLPRQISSTVELSAEPALPSALR